jgi:hypothetical protein
MLANLYLQHYILLLDPGNKICGILLGYEKNICGPHSKRKERSFPENNIYVGLS